MRYIDGIPESVIIKPYLGKYTNNFTEDEIYTFSPSRGGAANIPVYRWRTREDCRISVHYTGTQKSIYISFKIEWKGSHPEEESWDKTHHLMVSLYDPDGIQKAEEFIGKMVANHPDGWNKCCANQDT